MPVRGAHLRFFWGTGTADIPAGESEAEDAAKMAGLLAEREGSADLSPQERP